MKKILVLTFFIIVANSAHSQACGIYRIKYTGKISAGDKQILKLYVPTTRYLQGIEKQRSPKSFQSAPLKNGKFDLEMQSHITTPYTDIDMLLSDYRSGHKKLKLIVAYIDNKLAKSAVVEIDWKDIDVKIVDDNKFGTLFHFAINDITL